MSDYLDPSQKAKDDPFGRPTLVGCTWSTYGLDQPPWGVAQSDLLIGRNPAALVFAPRLICDVNAFAQEKRARDELGWTSSELLVELNKKKVLELEDFGPSVRSIFDEPEIKQAFEKLISSGLTDNQLLQEVRVIDNQISEGLSAENTGTPHPEARQVFYWQGDPTRSKKPFWSSTEKVVLTLFFDPDFYILPPRSLWPSEINNVVVEIGRRQAPHLNDLARLRVDGPQYLERLKKAHGKLDTVVDDFLRTHSAAPYGNYKQRLKTLLRVRENIRKSKLLEEMQIKWDQVSNNLITELEFQEHFRERIESQYEGLIRVKNKTKRDIAVSFTSSLITGLIAISPVGVADARFALGTIVSAGIFANAMYQRLQLGENFPMGWLELQRREIKYGK